MTLLKIGDKLLMQQKLEGLTSVSATGVEIHVPTVAHSDSNRNAEVESSVACVEQATSADVKVINSTNVQMLHESSKYYRK